MKSSKLKNTIFIRLKSTLNVGDLLLANTENKSNLGVLLEQQGNQLSMLKKDGHIVKCNLNSIVFKSSEWAFRNKIKSPVQSPIILPETEALMEMHSIPSHLPGHLNAFEGAAESKRELFKQKIESVHKDLIDKNLSEISLVDLCKLISGYPDTTPAEEFALMSTLRDGIFFKMQYPVVDIRNPSYLVRSWDQVTLFKVINDEISGSDRSNSQIQLFIDKSKEIISGFRNGKRKLLKFTLFEQKLIQILKDSLKSSMNKSGIEVKIALLGVIRRIGLYSQNPSQSDIKLFLREIGVFNQNEDIALHKDLKAGTFEELEGLSDVGDEVVSTAIEHGRHLLDNLNSSEKIPLMTKDRNPSPQMDKYKKKLLTNPVFSSEYHYVDPLEKLREAHNQPIFAIDSSNAHEIDDGVSIGETPNGTWIHVHIADPTTFVPKNSAIAQIAQLRGNSIYLAPRHFPLMPDFLSDNLFNLGKSSRALTFSGKLDDNGCIVDYRVTPMHLNNVKKITYDAANSVLDWNVVLHGAPWWATEQLNKRYLPKDQCISNDESQILSKIYSIALKHQNSRLQNNGIIPEQFNLYIRLKSAPVELSPRVPVCSFMGNSFLETSPIVIDTDVPQRSPAHILVSECMIIAGRIASRFFQDRKIPISYRCQLSPPEYALLHNQKNYQLAVASYEKALMNRNSFNGIVDWAKFENLMTYMPAAYMSPKPESHSSMGILGSNSINDFSSYVKVTSPLRRFQDMLGHFQIQDSLLNNSPSFSPEQVFHIAERMNDLHKKEKALSKLSERYWILEYLRRKCFDPDDTRIADFRNPKHLFEHKDNPNQKAWKGIPCFNKGRFGDYYCFVTIPELGGLRGKCIPKCDLTDDNSPISVIVERVEPLNNFILFRQI